MKFPSLWPRNSPERVTLRQYGDLLARYLGPQWLRVAWTAFLLFASIGLQLLGPQVIRVFIDAVQRGSSVQTLTLTALLFLAVALGSRLISALVTYFCEDVSWHATNRLRLDLVAHCLKLDRSFHTAHTPGELIERVDGDVNELAGFFAQFVVQVLGNVLLMLGIFVLVLRENAWFGLFLIVYMLATILIFVRFQALATPYFKARRQAAAEMSGFFGEVLTSLEDIAAGGAASYILRCYFHLQRLYYRAELRSSIFWAAFENIGLVIDNVCVALVLFGCTLLYLQHMFTLGTIVLLLSYTTQLLDNIFDLTEQFGSLQQATASIERINELYHIVSKVTEGPGITLQAGPLAVAFQHVFFAYEAEQPVLIDLTFELGAGEVVGLIGRSGSGKTTLTRLLMRFYDPVQGVILFNNQDIRQANLDDLRGCIGLVTQDVQLFQASLRDNLRFFDAAIDDQQIHAAIDRLGLAEWLTRLPAGLDTQLAGNGAGLSAGEAQLLACVRVFLKDPQLVILDEASSRLDPATERLLIQATDKLMQQRSGVIIAHRLSTVERVDHIMVLDAGRIVEYGSREQLAADPASRYAQLLQMSHPEEMLA